MPTKRTPRFDSDDSVAFVYSSNLRVAGGGTPGSRVSWAALLRTAILSGAGLIIVLFLKGPGLTQYALANAAVSLSAIFESGIFLSGRSGSSNNVGKWGLIGVFAGSCFACFSVLGLFIFFGLLSGQKLTFFFVWCPAFLLARLTVALAQGAAHRAKQAQTITSSMLAGGLCTGVCQVISVWRFPYNGLLVAGWQLGGTIVSLWILRHSLESSLPKASALNSRVFLHELTSGVLQSAGGLMFGQLDRIAVVYILPPAGAAGYVFATTIGVQISQISVGMTQPIMSFSPENYKQAQRLCTTVVYVLSFCLMGVYVVNLGYSPNWLPNIGFVRLLPFVVGPYLLFSVHAPGFFYLLFSGKPRMLGLIQLISGAVTVCFVAIGASVWGVQGALIANGAFVISGVVSGIAGKSRGGGFWSGIAYPYIPSDQRYRRLHVNRS